MEIARLEIQNFRGTREASISFGRHSVLVGANENRVSRGRFTFVFFLQAMAAIGAEWIQVPTAAALGHGEGLGHGGAQVLARTRKDTPYRREVTATRIAVPQKDGRRKRFGSRRRRS